MVIFKTIGFISLIIVAVSCTSSETAKNESNSFSNHLPKMMNLDSINVDSRMEVEDLTPFKIGNLEIYRKDLEANKLIRFDANQAKEECLKLGDGWRLPNQQELQLIMDNIETLGEFKNNYYWGLVNDNTEDEGEIFLRLNVVSGELIENFQELSSIYSLRPVRTVE